MNDARIAGGVTNAHFNVGALDFNIQDGAIRALGTLNSERPELIAGSFIASTTDSFDVNARPIVVLVRDGLTISGPGIIPIFAFGILPLTAFNSENLVSVFASIQNRNDFLVDSEKVEEIDSAYSQV